MYSKIDQSPISSSEPAPLPDMKPLHYYYFKAIKRGDLQMVENWFAIRTFFWENLEKAAINLALSRREKAKDLALSSRYEDIAAVIQIILEDDKIEQKERFSSSSPFSGPYRRASQEFDRDCYFYEINFESHLHKPIDNCTNAMANIWVCYRTSLEEPFLADAFEGLPYQNLNMHFRFDFSSIEHDINEIKTTFNLLLTLLTTYGKKDGSPVDTNDLSFLEKAMNTFINDLETGFSAPSDYKPRVFKETPITYDGFKLYNAAREANPKKMQSALKKGANPDAIFDMCTPLFVAAYLGVNYVFNERSPGTQPERFHDLLQTVKLLLEYKADPNQSWQQRTWMEYLVWQSVSDKTERQEIYQEMINLVNTTLHSRPHISVHESQQSLTADTVRRVNQQMQKKQNTEVFVQDVERGINQITLMMKDGYSITIESRIIEELKFYEPAKYHQILTFFDEHPNIVIETASSSTKPTSSSFFQDESSALSKKQYLANLMHSNLGTGYIDIIWHKEKLLGFIISEQIIHDLNGRTTLINYGKLVLAHIPSQYPGLLKGLIWLRAFAPLQNPSESHASIYFYEAASSRGFGIADTLKRFPLYHVLEEETSQLISLLYPEETEIMQEQGTYYIKDPLLIKEPPERQSDLATRTTLVRANFETEYQRLGWVIPIAFPANHENYAILKQSLMPLLGEDALAGLMNFFSQECRTSEPQRARL